MPVRIGLIGSQGKMGLRLLSFIEKSQDFSLAWQLHSKSPRDGLPPADAIIDFSSPEALKDNLWLAQRSSTPIVIGTTGIGNEGKAALEASSSLIPVFWAPNFSIGIEFLKQTIETFASCLQKKFSPKIIETHHVHKKDSPSGSALALAESLLVSWGEKPPIESVRLGNVIGKHTVVFSSEYEILSLEHESLSRDVFAEGALHAVNFLINQPPGLYGMKQLLACVFPIDLHP